MPLVDIECSNGHLTEVLKRGAVTGPFACPQCEQPAEAKFPVAAFVIEAGSHPEYVEPVKRKPRGEVFERAGGGRGYRDSRGNERPALSHNAKCPQCKRYRNVAILGTIGYALNLMCEACGYSWYYHEATAPDPMFTGVVEAYRPGKNYSSNAPAGSGYVEPRRAG